MHWFLAHESWLMHTFGGSNYTVRIWSLSRIKLKCLLQGNARFRTDLILCFFCVFWGEEVQGTTIITFPVLVPETLGGAVRHALDGGQDFVVRKVLSAHF
jgi:hypothetical protein